MSSKDTVGAVAQIIRLSGRPFHAIQSSTKTTTSTGSDLENSEVLTFLYQQKQTSVNLDDLFFAYYCTPT